MMCLFQERELFMLTMVKQNGHSNGRPPRAFFGSGGIDSCSLSPAEVAYEVWVMPLLDSASNSTLTPINSDAVVCVRSVVAIILGSVAVFGGGPTSTSAG